MLQLFSGLSYLNLYNRIIVLGYGLSLLRYLVEYTYSDGFQLWQQCALVQSISSTTVLVTIKRLEQPLCWNFSWKVCFAIAAVWKFLGYYYYYCMLVLWLLQKGIKFDSSMLWLFQLFPVFVRQLRPDNATMLLLHASISGQSSFTLTLRVLMLLTMGWLREYI